MPDMEKMVEDLPSQQDIFLSTSSTGACRLRLILQWISTPSHPTHPTHTLKPIHLPTYSPTYPSSPQACRAASCTDRSHTEHVLDVCWRNWQQATNGGGGNQKGRDKEKKQGNEMLDLGGRLHAKTEMIQAKEKEGRSYHSQFQILA